MGESGSQRQVIVPCGGGHRVRLGRGLNFWRIPRCPRCRRAVDPTRMRRVVAGAWGLIRPASDRWGPRLAWWTAVGATGMVVIAALLLWSLGDRWWPATVLLFGPRWILALPLGIAVILAVAHDRAVLPILGVTALILAGPVIEFRTGWRALHARPDPSRDLTVVSYNVGGGRHLSTSAFGMVERWDADLLLFQECGGVLREEILARAAPPLDREEEGTDVLAALGMARQPGWYADHRPGTGLCILSRLPILTVEDMEREHLVAAGGSGQVSTWHLDAGGREIRATGVHLETPRGGFERLLTGDWLASTPLISQRSTLRTIEHRQARSWLDLHASSPRIIAGDFNTPPESRAFRAYWNGWTNAWGHAGRGYGGTRLNGWIRPRIDHILVDARWQVVSARVGEDLGSDHLPVVATVRLR